MNPKEKAEMTKELEKFSEDADGIDYKPRYEALRAAVERVIAAMHSGVGYPALTRSQIEERLTAALSAAPDEGPDYESLIDGNQMWCPRCRFANFKVRKKCRNCGADLSTPSPDTSTVARVVADMREHQGHIQLGACIKGWCDALAGAGDVPEEPWMKESCDRCNTKFTKPPFVVCHGCFAPSPGTIAAADVAAVLEKKRWVRHSKLPNTEENQGWDACFDMFEEMLQSLITAAGSPEPPEAPWKIPRDHVIVPRQAYELLIEAAGEQKPVECSECRRELTPDELWPVCQPCLSKMPNEPQVPLAVVDEVVREMDAVREKDEDSKLDWIKGWNCCDSTYAMKLHAALAPYRPTAKEPCATCGGTHMVPLGTGINGTCACPDCQPPFEPNAYDDAGNPIQYKVTGGSPKPTPPLTYAQRAAYWLSLPDSPEPRVGDMLHHFAKTMAGHNDTAVLKWLQAQEKEESDDPK